ncbi:hypothetical protein OROMI_005305 [Orobanche minor]
MGACTSRHEVLKNTGEAPLPAPAIEEVEVIKEEVITDKQEDVSVAADGDEAKRQSLRNLFKESEEEKGLPENTSEQVKQEDVKPQEDDDDAVETEKEVVVTVEASSEENKTGSAEAISDEEKPEEKLAADETVIKTAETSPEKAEEEKSEAEEKQKTTASDEKKPLFKLWF